MTQPGETEGMNIIDHVRWIIRISGITPDYLIASESPIPYEMLKNYQASGAQPLVLEEEQKNALGLMGTRVIVSDYLSISGGSVRHNSQKLSETLVRIAREERDTAKWRI
jgi:hypothetical protein